MPKKINIKMELNYDLEDFRFMVGEDFPEEQFRERVLDYAIEDIHSYIRDFALDEWCEVEEIE